MIRIRVVNKTRKKIGISFVRKIIKKALEVSEKRIGDVSLTVIFVSRDKIKSLNCLYRRKDRPTDILSFNYSSAYNKNKVEGELFLCPAVIKKSARENKISFESELAFTLSHGILHLLGFRHGKEMYKIQDEVSASVGRGIISCDNNKRKLFTFF